MKYVRKRLRSLSPPSSDNHATGLPQLAIHSLTRVVLPKPAGAEMSVSLPSSPSFIRSIRRGRGTRFLRTGGVNNFVDNNSGDISLHYSNKLIYPINKYLEIV